MVLNAILLIAVALAAFVGYHVYKIYIAEQNRISKQDAAYNRFIADNEKAGNIFPSIDISGHIQYVKYNGNLLTLEEWEEEPHQFTSYVSNYLHRKSNIKILVI